jgi:3-hydroxyacyl-[acyl-carrier-protein] dehydratase
VRWFWIDRFIEFRRGRRAVALKNVTAGEEQLVDNFFSYPIMPASLIVEGLAQTGGILVSEFFEFRQRVVLAKVGKAIFHDYAIPGDSLRYSADVEDIKPDGAICHGKCHVVNYGEPEQLLAEVEMVFALLDDARFAGVDLFGPGDLLRMLRVTGVFEVGVTETGEPIPTPAHLAAADPKPSV